MRKFVWLVALATIVLSVFLVKTVWVGVRPFRDLKREEISSVEVALYPPNMEITVSEDNLDELIALLQEIVTYEEDGKEYAGQSIVFHITKTDGTQVTFTEVNPQLTIDGKGYRTKYQPCDKLNQFIYNLTWKEQRV